MSEYMRKPNRVADPGLAPFPLSSFFRAVEELAAVRIAYYDLAYLVKNSPRFIMEEVHGCHDGTPYCKAINRSKAGNAHCSWAETEKVRLIQERGEPLLCTCPMGVRELGIPCMVRGELVGVVWIGGLFPGDGDRGPGGRELAGRSVGQRKVFVRKIPHVGPLQTRLQRLIALCRPLEAVLDASDRRKDSGSLAGDAVPAHLPVNRRLSPSIARVVDHMRGAYREPFSVKQAARLAGLSEGYFCRLFTRETGMTFHKRLLEHRLEAALFLLKRRPDKLNEVAALAGFQSLASFNRQIRLRYRMSPSQLRLRPSTVKRSKVGPKGPGTSGQGMIDYSQ